METNSEVVAAVADLANEADKVAVTDAVIETVVEAAQERVEAAEKTAEQIAAAAMESERGREIQEIRKDIGTWLDKQSNLEMSLSNLSQRLETLAGQISAIATLEMAEQIQQTPISSSLNLPNSEALPEAIAEVETIVPESLSENVVAENPAPLETPKRKRWI